jgi:hypothetical protein
MVVVAPTSAASASLLKVFFQNVAAAMVQKEKEIAPAMDVAQTFGEVVFAGSFAPELPPVVPLCLAAAAGLAAEAGADVGDAWAEATVGAAAGVSPAARAGAVA